MMYACYVSFPLLSLSRNDLTHTLSRSLTCSLALSLTHFVAPRSTCLSVSVSSFSLSLTHPSLETTSLCLTYSMSINQVEEDIDWLIHNSGVLSARGEQNPELAFEVNVLGYKFCLSSLCPRTHVHMWNHCVHIYTCVWGVLETEMKSNV